MHCATSCFCIARCLGEILSQGFLGLGSIIICSDFNELEDFNQIGDEKGIGIYTFQCRLLRESPCHESLERFLFFDIVLYSRTTVCV